MKHPHPRSCTLSLLSTSKQQSRSSVHTQTYGNCKTQQVWHITYTDFLKNTTLNDRVKQQANYINYLTSLSICKSTSLSLKNVCHWLSGLEFKGWSAKVTSTLLPSICVSPGITIISSAISRRTTTRITPSNNCQNHQLRRRKNSTVNNTQTLPHTSRVSPVNGKSHFFQ